MMNYPLTATSTTNSLRLSSSNIAVTSTSPKRSSMTTNATNSKKRRSSSSSLSGAPGVTLQPFDVLSGRDKQSFNHIGNRRFRVVINMNLQRYLDTKSRFERSEMILSFVRELRGDGNIRFIKRRGSKYIELNEKQSREKVGHALRDAAAQARQQERNQQQSSTTATATTTVKKVKKSKAAKSKQQQQKLKKRKQQQQQPQLNGLEFLNSSLPVPPPLSPATLSADIGGNDDEFSLSDDSMDSLLSLIDENQEQPQLHKAVEEKKDGDNEQVRFDMPPLPQFGYPSAFNFDDMANIPTAATANSLRSGSILSAVDMMNTDIDQEQFASFLTSQAGTTIAI